MSTATVDRQTRFVVPLHGASAWTPADWSPIGMRDWHGPRELEPAAGERTAAGEPAEAGARRLPGPAASAIRLLRRSNLAATAVFRVEELLDAASTASAGIEELIQTNGAGPCQAAIDEFRKATQAVVAMLVEMLRTTRRTGPNLARAYETWQQAADAVLACLGYPAVCPASAA